jgi:hypothetical protein
MANEKYKPLREFFERCIGHLQYYNLLTEYKLRVMPDMETSRPFVFGHGSWTNAERFYFKKFSNDNRIENPEDIEDTLTALEEHISATCIQTLDRIGGQEYPVTFNVQTWDLIDDWNFRNSTPNSTLTFIRDRNKENTGLLCKFVHDSINRDRKRFSCGVSDQLRPFLIHHQADTRQEPKMNSSLSTGEIVSTLVVVGLILYGIKCSSWP